MDANSFSRRTFVLSGAGYTAASSASTQEAAGALRAGQVIDRIKENVGIPWRDKTVDNIIAGSLNTPVKGVAVTMMATLDVIQRSAAAGMNMVITHEPTFYSHQDNVSDLTKNATYQYKLNFLRENDMVVFHFHDHWHGRRPDGIATGMVRELGWESNADSQNPRLFIFPKTPLARFAKQIQSRLKIRTMRIVGDPDLPVSRVMASWGNLSRMPGIPWLAQPDVDVLIIGETNEWELVEYTQDIITLGKKKALILLGHMLSEQAGMKYCAEWLKSFITEVPIEFIQAPEPYWNPDNTTS